jgi:ribonuclease HI
MADFLIYTDGSALGNPGPGGWGAVIWDTVSDWVEEMGGAQNPTTNNQMELQGAISALRKIDSHPGNTLIRTDSEYLIKGIHIWILGWKSRGWKNAAKEPVKNRERWEELDALVEARKALGSTVKFEHVSAHSGIPANERCDEIAKSFAAQNPVELHRGWHSEYSIVLSVEKP